METQSLVAVGGTMGRNILWWEPCFIHVVECPISGGMYSFHCCITSLTTMWARARSSYSWRHSRYMLAKTQKCKQCDGDQCSLCKGSFCGLFYCFKSSAHRNKWGRHSPPKESSSMPRDHDVPRPFICKASSWVKITAYFFPSSKLFHPQSCVLR